jgi:hypothetical protein
MRARSGAIGNPRIAAFRFSRSTPDGGGFMLFVADRKRKEDDSC